MTAAVSQLLVRRTEGGAPALAAEVWIAGAVAPPDESRPVAALRPDTARVAGRVLLVSTESLPRPHASALRGTLPAGIDLAVVTLGAELGLAPGQDLVLGGLVLRCERSGTTQEIYGQAGHPGRGALLAVPQSSGFVEPGDPIVGEWPLAAPPPAPQQVSTPLRRYLELESLLTAWRSEGADDAHESHALQDEMDSAWYALSSPERSWFKMYRMEGEMQALRRWRAWKAKGAR